MQSTLLNQIFEATIQDYHLHDHVDHPINNPHQPRTLEHVLYQKCWIDTVQWHLEDIIRDPEIQPEAALVIKRRIDASNQDRTDCVEKIDDYIFKQYSSVTPSADARLNTETPAWAVDRLSILHLKIWHMREETERTDAEEAHILKCQAKLNQLLTQKEDLSLALDQLLAELKAGTCIVKTYKQMKMYNDDELNPVLRQRK